MKIVKRSSPEIDKTGKNTKRSVQNCLTSSTGISGIAPHNTWGAIATLKFLHINAQVHSYFATILMGFRPLTLTTKAMLFSLSETEDI